jgi:hypothetical protein
MEYRTHRCLQPIKDTPRVTLLLQVDGSGHGGEGFRFTVDCDQLTATIWSRDLFDAPELEGYKLVYDLRGEDIEIRPNSMASKWEDLETLIGKERILVFNPEWDEVLNAAFRKKFNAEKAANERLGAALRWVVQASIRGELKLILQGFPAGAISIRAEPLLTTDECSTIHLDTFETKADLKADHPGRGPVPVLFVRDPDTVRDVLSRHSEKIFPSG